MADSLSVNDLTHNYGERKIFEGAGISFTEGEITGIIGGNGSGKSTLFKILIGAVKADKVKINLNGQVVIDTTTLHNQIGYCTQEIFLPKTMLVRDLIFSYFDDGDIQNKIFYSPGIYHLEKKRVYQLSQGERRYVQILLVLNLDKRFLIFDEPFSMVAPLFRESLKEKLLDCKKDKAIIITDHYYQDVFDMADRIYTIYDHKFADGVEAQNLIDQNYLKR